MERRKQRLINWKIPVSAIIALCIMECVALSNGINGTVFSVVIAAVAGLGGWAMPQLKTGG